MELLHEECERLQLSWKKPEEAAETVGRKRAVDEGTPTTPLQGEETVCGEKKAVIGFADSGSSPERLIRRDCVVGVNADRRLMCEKKIGIKGGASKIYSNFDF